MIRRPHIIIINYSDTNLLEKNKKLTDVFNAFPDVSFTFETQESPSAEEVIYYHKKYQNVVFKFNKMPKKQFYVVEISPNQE